jgi:uncharacterized protein YjbI with pentapeptide repeats/predicted DNA-binding WGR domain protein
MAKREFRFEDGKSSKFWEIELDDKSHTVRFGRIGTAGQSKSKDFATPEEARKSHDALIAAKTKKGYVEFGVRKEGDLDLGQVVEATASEPKPSVAPAVAPPDPTPKPAPAEPSPWKDSPRRSFELDTGKVLKFAKLEIESGKTSVLEGKLSKKSFKDEASAVTAFQKLVSKMVEKGWTEVDVGQPPPPIRHTPDSVCVKELARSFDTLQEAVERAEPGMTILLKEGLYQESVLVDKDLVILGPDDGSSCTLRSPVGTALVITAAAARVKGLTLRSGPRMTKQGWQDQGVVHITSGASVIEDCDIQALGFRRPVEVIGPEANPTLRGCRIHDSIGGPRFSGGAAGLMVDCEIDHCGGISIIEESKTVVRGCRIYRCVRGVSTGSGLVENCHFWDNGSGGQSGDRCWHNGGHLWLGGTGRCRDSKFEGCGTELDGTAIVENCEFLAGGKVANIFVGAQHRARKEGWVTIRGCSISGGEKHLVYVRPGFALVCEDTKLSETPTIAIAVEGQAWIKGCTFIANGHAVLTWGGQIFLEDCEVTDSTDVAVFVNAGHGYCWNCRISNGGASGLETKASRHGSPGTIGLDNCEVRGNSEHGLRCEAGDYTVRNSHICDNGQVGLVGPGTATACVLAGNKEAATRGEAVLTDCTEQEDSSYGKLPPEKKALSLLALEFGIANGHKDFRGREMSRCAAKGVSLDSVDLSEANLAGSRWERCLWRGLVAKGANLDGARMEFCKFFDSDFSGLVGRKSVWHVAGLSGVCLREASLEGAKISGRIEKDESYTPPDFSQAELTRAELGGDLTGASFVKVQASGVKITAKMNGSDFTGANLEKAEFSAGGEFGQACFREANLREASLLNCNLTESDFSGADLRGAKLTGANLTNAKFEGALLEGSCFDHAKIEGVVLPGELAAQYQAAAEAKEAAQQAALEKERQRKDAIRQRAEQLALECFGEQVKSHLGGAVFLLDVPLVRDFGMPEALLHATKELLALESRIDSSPCLCTLELFAKPEKPTLPSDNNLYQGLFDFGKQWYHKETEFEHHGEGEFTDPGMMATEYTHHHTADQFEHWVTEYVHSESSVETAKEVGVSASERKARLKAWLKEIRPLLFQEGSSIPAYGLTDEGNENTEWGLYLVLGHQAAVVISRHYHL